MQWRIRRGVCLSKRARLAVFLTLGWLVLQANPSGVLAQPPAAGAAPDPANRPRGDDVPAPGEVKVGLLANDPAAFQGYTLVAPMMSTETYLIDMQGRVVHSWKSDHPPALSAYLLENGHLLRPARSVDPGWDSAAGPDPAARCRSSPGTANLCGTSRSPMRSRYRITTLLDCPTATS